MRPSARAGSPTGLAIIAGICGSLDSVLNIAFPDLTDDLNLPVDRIGLIIVSYVGVFGLGLVPAGRLVDRRGGRLTIAIGGFVTVAGLALAATATGLPSLLIGRIVQGAGTAMVMAAAPSLLTRTAGPDAQGRALGMLQTSTGVGLTLGPLIGGLIVASWGWRAVFGLRIPLFVLLVVIAVATAEPRTAPTDQRVPLGPILRNGAFIRANLANLIASGAAFAVFIFGPSYMVDELGASELVGGIVLALWAGALALVSPVAGRLTDRHDPGPAAMGGLGLLVVGLVIGAVASSVSSLSLLAASSLVTGAGLGLFTVANMTFVMGSLDQEHQGVAGGITLTMRTIGLLASVGVLTLVFNTFGDADVGRGLTATFIAAAIATLGAIAVSRRRPDLVGTPDTTIDRPSA